MTWLKYILSFFLLFFILPGFTQDAGMPYAEDIVRFKEIDKINPPPQYAILFAGSSSFTLWKDVQDYFPGFTIINRGFGGSTLLDQIHYVENIVFPYSPKQIVIYCGENDLASSDTISSDLVTNRFVTWFNLVRTELPDVRITYVSMKPSPSRWHLAEKFIEANRNIHKFIDSQTNAAFVNIWDSMLNENNRPDPDLFLDDSLHMNTNGYRIWQKLIQPELINKQ